MKIRWCVMAASALMSLHLSAAETLHTGISISVDQVRADRGIDPTYATGDPTTYNSFGIHGSFQASKHLVLNAQARGAYNHHYDLTSGIIDFEAGIKTPFPVTSEISVAALTGLQSTYTFMEAQSPAQTSLKTGFYAGMSLLYQPLLSRFEFLTHYKKSTIESSSIGAGIGFWKTHRQRLALEYIDEGFKRRIRASFGFAF